MHDCTRSCVQFRRHISFVFAATAGIEHSTEASTAKLDRFTRLATVMTFCFALYLGYHLYNLGELTASSGPSPYFHRQRLPSVLSLLRNVSLGALLAFLYATAREERTTRRQRGAAARASLDGAESDAAYWASSDGGSVSVSDASMDAGADAGEDAGADARADLGARLLPSEADDDRDHRSSRFVYGESEGAGAGA
jgi:hypothetical protein